VIHQKPVFMGSFSQVIYTQGKVHIPKKEVAMPKRIIPLTDVKIAKAKPQKKPQTR